MTRTLVVGAVREQDRGQHLQRDREHFRGDAVLRLLGGDDVVLPRRRTVPAALDRPRAPSETRVEQPALPGARDVSRVLLARLVLLRRRRAHDVDGGEVVGVALLRRVGLEPGTDVRLELLPVGRGTALGLALRPRLVDGHVSAHLSGFVLRGVLDHHDGLA